MFELPPPSQLCHLLYAAARHTYGSSKEQLQWLALAVTAGLCVQHVILVDALAAEPALVLGVQGALGEGKELRAPLIGECGAVQIFDSGDLGGGLGARRTGPAAGAKGVPSLGGQGSAWMEDSG